MAAALGRDGGAPFPEECLAGTGKYGARRNGNQICKQARHSLRGNICVAYPKSVIAVEGL